MRWQYFSRPRKAETTAELQKEVAILKDAELKTKAHKDLLQQKEALLKSIKKEGFKLRHRKALTTIHMIERGLLWSAKETGKGLIYAGRKGRPYAHKFLKKRHKKLAKYI